MATPRTMAEPPQGISHRVWIQTLLRQAGVSQADIAQLTQSNESVVSRVVYGKWLPENYTPRGLARQLAIQQCIAEQVGVPFEDLWPDAVT